MKIKNIFFGLMSGALFLTGCDVNELPAFNDADAFVAFTTGTGSINENSTDSLVIEVLCSSLNGVSAEVSFSIVEDTTATAAKVGELFTYYTTTGKDTLSFDNKTTSQYIIVKPIDNEEFGGDKKFTLQLKDAKGANLGASNTITVAVVDNEHPLAAILGSYTASGTTYNGPSTWDVTIAKDEKDLNTVWFTNLPAASIALGIDGRPIYGVVNEDKTEILIPVHQQIATSSNYPYVAVDGADGEEGEEDIPEGGNLVATIGADGTITVQNWMIVNAYTDEGGTSLAGYFGYVEKGAVLTKK